MSENRDLTEQEATVHQNPGLPFWPPVILKNFAEFPHPGNGTENKCLIY